MCRKGAEKCSADRTEAGGLLKGDNHNVAAHRLMRDPKVEAAIFEVARSHMNTFGPLLAAHGMLKIAANEKHPDHSKMILAVADRTGLHPRTEHKVMVEHRDDDRMVEICPPVCG